MCVCVCVCVCVYIHWSYMRVMEAILVIQLLCVGEYEII